MLPYRLRYANDRLLWESFGSNTLDFFYDSNSNAYALKYNGTLYYITNLQGDVMSIVDAQGAVVASYNYDPYGNLISDEPAENTIGHLNPLRYRGYYYDSESGLYYLQSRYYDPEIGRFLNADAFASTGQGIIGNNMFAYCLNNPVRYEDSRGNQSEDATDDENEDEDEYRLVGAGIQLDFSGTLDVGHLGGSVGFGVEVIIYWDTSECAAYGKPIIAVYCYNEGNGCFNLDYLYTLATEITELLTENIDVIKLDGTSAIEAIIKGHNWASLSASVTVSALGVWGNADFYGVDKYTEGFENKSITVGSIKGGYAWSDCCKTYSIGYSWSIGTSSKLSITRGKSYYHLLWDSR